MASSILNSDDGVISGTSGLKSTGGDDGVLVFQSKGTETARINTDKQIVAAAGTASLPIYSTTGDTNTGIFFPAADTIAFAEGGAEAMRITSDARVGIGTNAPANKLTLNENAEVLLGIRSGDANIAGILFGDQSDASRGSVYYDNTNDSMQFRVNNQSEAMRIDSSGNVGIGTTSPSGRLHVSGVSADIWLTDTAGTPNTWRILAKDGTTPALRFYDQTNAAERARITSGGDFLVNRTSTNGKVCADRSGTDVGNGFHYELTGATISAGQVGFRFVANGTGGNSVDTRAFIVRTENADRCYIYGTGNIVNTNNSYGTLSDIKLKQDIIDAGSQWNDIKSIRIRKYRFKSDPTMPLQIGVVAQELEEVSPGLIEELPDYEEVKKNREVEKTREVTPAVLDEENNEIEPAVTETYTEEEEYTEREATGTVTKSVKSSILYMKAIKALQEAMERIETLEAKVAALEGN